MQLEVCALALAGKVLDGAGLGIGFGHVLADEVLQKGIDVVRGLGHGLLEGVAGVVLVAHQFGLLGAQLGDFAGEGEGVVLVGAVGTVDGSLEDAAAQLSVVQVGEERLLCGVDDDDGVGCLAAQILGIFRTLGDVGLAEPCQLVGCLHPHHGVVGGIGQVVAPLLLQVGDASVYGFHAFHLVLGQECSPAHEILVNFLQEFLVFTGECIVLTVIDLTDSLEEGLVEGDLVLEIGEQRLHLFLYFSDFGCLVCLYQCEEDATDAVEETSAVLEGQDGVLEGGAVGVVGNLLDALALLLHGSLEGRQVVGGLDLAEVRCAERQLALRQQGILAPGLLAGDEGHRHGRCDTEGHKCLIHF